MHTTQGNQIDNEQLDEIGAIELKQMPHIEQKYSPDAVCADANPRFNCHGLTFASRRTGIFDSAALKLILCDDGYEEVPKDQVKAGDVIMYYSADGDFEHSGLVVEPPRTERLGVALVRSKWGKARELIHWGNRCPYESSNVKYFRIMK